MQQYSNTTIHYITFDNPFPPNYGGIIVVFNTLKGLKKMGVDVVLHCFVYGNNPIHSDLEQFCSKIYYYPRNKSVFDLFSNLPFIIKSRSDSDLLNNLLKDKLPIFFDSIHSSLFLCNSQLADRQKVVRLHNIESNYYLNLSKLEKNVFKKIFFWLESKKIAIFEQKHLPKAQNLITITQKDADFYQKIHQNTHFIPIQYEILNHTENRVGKGQYFLFPAKLSVEDNHQAAIFLIEKVFQFIDFQFVIAGLSPKNELIKIAKKYPNIKIIANPNQIEMTQFFQNAQGCILWSNQNDGIKLKLVEALSLSRFCIVNEKVIAGSGFEKICYIADNDQDMINEINKIKETEFTLSESIIRQNLLENYLDNENNLNKILSLLSNLQKVTY